MTWLQTEHSKGLNSLIIAHQISGSEVIRDMMQRMVENFGKGNGGDRDEDGDGGERLTLRRVGRSGASLRLVERDCTITIGSAERPDSSRGGDYNLVHLSEVGLWKQTRGKKPEDIVRSATSGVLLKPGTMIVMESTANGAGTYFHREYIAAKEGQSQFGALFIPWYEIESYRMPVADPEGFAAQLLAAREETVAEGRAQSGSYLWSLWERGATLEAINWYIAERKKYSTHGAMAAEYPTDDLEAFQHSGERVFDPEAVERLRRDVREPIATGDITEPLPRLLPEQGGDPEEALEADSRGCLKIWKWPERVTAESGRMSNRYLAVVDVGGRSDRADWSVIAVFDRTGERPEVVAQWRGHIDHDLLAAKAAGIARWYHRALLVIESNTLETHDAERDVDGLQAPFLLRELEDSYPNLYMRPTGSGGARPGFHTNVNTKPMVVGTLVKMVRDGGYIERDSRALEELTQYERKPNGAYGAYSGCHDDILMTRAIALHVHEHEMDPPRRTGSAAMRQCGAGRRAQDAFGVF